MRYGFISLLGLLLVSSVPAAAQTFAAEIPPPRESIPRRLVLPALPSRPASPSPAIRLNLKLPAAVPDHFTDLLSASYQPESNLATRFSIEEDRTPFASESSMPVAQLGKGRLQIAGFQQTIREYPQFTGQPLPPRIPDQARVTRSEDLAGLSLRFNLGKGSGNQPVQVWRSLRSFFGR